MDTILGFSLESWKKGKVPMLDTYPLYGNPLPIACILFAYLIFVLRLGPNFMKSRQPYNLKYVIVLYNALQVGYNFYAWQLAVSHPWFWNTLLSFGCSEWIDKEGQHASMLVTICWHVTLSKLLDLLDSVFFVLCKKQSNITFLHVQHHFLNVAITWVCAKYYMGGEFSMVVFCNSIVHMIMYFYYFIAALGPEYKKYLWWKKQLTTVQIIQFLILIAYSTASLWLSCSFNKTISLLIIANVSLNLILFLNFYFKTYGSEKLLKDKFSVCGSLQFNHNYSEQQQGSSLDTQHSKKRI